ncbi:MAG: hypothetical protein D3917_07060 [Candidatus Electrothrix sp. AX5]|nr:hypothetical protein [Candidatus Electrothrix sp. AX5]
MSAVVNLGAEQEERIDRRDLAGQIERSDRAVQVLPACIAARIPLPFVIFPIAGEQAHPAPAGFRLGQGQIKASFDPSLQLAEEDIPVDEMALAPFFGSKGQGGDEIQADLFRVAQGIFLEQVSKAAAAGRFGMMEGEVVLWIFQMLGQPVQEAVTEYAVFAVREDQLQRVDGVLADAVVRRAIQWVVKILVMRDACLFGSVFADCGKHGQRVLPGKGVAGVAQFDAERLPGETEQGPETGKDFLHDRAK